MLLQMDRSDLLKALSLIREHPEWNIILYKDEDLNLLEDDDRLDFYNALWWIC